MMCGGLSTSQPATPEIQEIADKVKAQLEEKENKKFDVFKAVSFKKQVVAGLNYFIKVHVGDEKFTHLRVYESLPHENKPLTLSNYETDKTKHDEISYF
ncbi:PREDICTED: cystatin-B [Chrysochloris asiatica]|uniref:Cystatin-B n=1 Tax=Chrysochloris asiatica TaxID=185453 RepID=A0A9B0WW25_CHRAS|nr:PREDICTED: cystatin-B [Chrysochloris asiatica]